MNSQSRQPKGIPVGGEFASHDRTESDIALGGAGELTASFSMTYTEMVLPTPRHRIPQPVETETTVEATVPQVTGEDAPVSMVVPDFAGERTLRLWNGKLLASALDHHGNEVPATPEKLEALIRSRLQYSRNSHTAVEVQREVDEALAGYVAVDGHLWTEAPEPVYVVRTYGMGHNHGGTGIVILPLHPNTDLAEVYYADEFELALAEAQRVARERGDTDSLAHLAETDQIQVHNPAALTPAIERVVRVDLPTVSKYDGLQAVDAAMPKFVSELSRVPGAIVVERDGETKTRRINFAALTDSQERAARNYLEARAALGLI